MKSQTTWTTQQDPQHHTWLDRTHKAQVVQFASHFSWISATNIDGNTEGVTLGIAGMGFNRVGDGGGAGAGVDRQST